MGQNDHSQLKIIISNTVSMLILTLEVETSRSGLFERLSRSGNRSGGMKSLWWQKKSLLIIITHLVQQFIRLSVNSQRNTGNNYLEDIETLRIEQFKFELTFGMAVGNHTNKKLNNFWKSQ